jgi:hypothetical protein
MRFGHPIRVYPFYFGDPDEGDEIIEQMVAEGMRGPDLVLTRVQAEADIVLAWIDTPFFLEDPSRIVFAAALLGQMYASAERLTPVFSVPVPEDHEHAALAAVIREYFAALPGIGTFPMTLHVFEATFYQGIPYQDYLKTMRWAEKRAEARAAAGDRCQLCNAGNRTLHVHHRTYERRGHERPDDLIVLCAHCHAKFHDKLPREAQ